MQPLAAEDDIAGLGQKPTLRPVYLIRKDDRLERLILPVEGKGLWSTMHGFVALGPDLATIKTFCMYDHAETPGLGGEVSSPKWLALWDGKTALDARREPADRSHQGLGRSAAAPTPTTRSTGFPVRRSPAVA